MACPAVTTVRGRPDFSERGRIYDADFRVALAPAIPPLVCVVNAKEGPCHADKSRQIYGLATNHFTRSKQGCISCSQCPSACRKMAWARDQVHLTTQNFTTYRSSLSISSQIVLYSNHKECTLIHKIYYTSICLVTSYFCQVSKLASPFHSSIFAQNCPRSLHSAPQQAKPCTQPPRSAHQHQKSLI